MKGPTRQKLVAALAIALAGVALALFAWVVSTPQGARWLLASVSSLSGGRFSARKIEGEVNDHLLLRGVRADLGQQQLKFDSLELRWKPMLLLTGTVAIQELSIRGGKIQDDAPDDGTPPDLTWPRASQAARLLDGRILRLRVTNLSYRHLRGQPLLLTSLTGSVTWQDGTLSIAGLSADTPSGRARGMFSAGFTQPSLTTDLAIELAQPVADMNQFTLRVRRIRSSGTEQLAGAIMLAGSADTRKLLEVGGEAGLTRNSFTLRRLRLTRPGRKGLITADGSLAFPSGEPVLSLRLAAEGLDLAPELNMPTDLSGVLRIGGTMENYRGDVTLANRARGWQAATASATFRGARNGMKLVPAATLLGGSVSGDLELDWSNGFALRGALSGRHLNPARIDPSWKGVANFNARGTLAWSGKSPLTGSVNAALLESSLHGQPLTGSLQADFNDTTLSLARLTLQGKGFDLHASGILNQRLTLAARISDFSRLVPGSAGTLQADGWLRWRDRQLSGAVAGSGSKLAYAGTRATAATLSVRLDQATRNSLHAAASLRDLTHGSYRLHALTLSADGSLTHHTLNTTLRSNNSDARMTLAAGYSTGIWKGEISRLAGRDDLGSWNMTAPATFSLSAHHLRLSPLSLSAGTAERLNLAVDLALNPLSGQVRSQWAGLNLGRANPYLKEMHMAGSSDGTLRLDFLSGKRLSLSGSASASGTYTGQGRSIRIQKSRISLDGGAQGLRAHLDLVTAASGTVKGDFISTAPLSLALPEKGKLTAELSGIDLVLLKPWLPADTGLEGHISGRVQGVTLPGQRFELDGTAVLSGGTVHRKRPGEELNLSFKTASATWGWRGESLSGDLSLTMAQYGQARATFQLPVPARFPLALNHKGPVRMTLTGQLQEKGIITALFPGLIQESSGELTSELAVSGTWDAPQIGGKVRLAKAGAYLPTAGIHLKDVQLAARLEKNLIRIDSFRAVSGPGHMEGTALITLDGWRVTGYKGTISGENFQTVNFPELHMQSTPNFSFEGTPEKLRLRGELRLPELRITGTASRTAITPSSDVIVEGRGAPISRKSSPLVLDARIRVLIGERVFVKVAGIDAQLGGAMDLTMASLDRITSSGEIKVVKGKYRTYGVNLDIARGRLFFAGVPIDRPSLDFLALRTVGDVRAGVTVTGTLQRPVTKLYSEPALPDVDILAYIVLGHPLGSNGAQTSLMAQAAGALLSTSQAAVLLDQIKNYLGLSTLEIQGGAGGTTNSMGYKPLQVTPPGSIPTTQQTGVTDTMLTVGKYLTPELYLSYGRSLFTGSNLFRLRYDLSKHWQIETQTGSESGVDLFYKLEFK